MAKRSLTFPGHQVITTTIIVTIITGTHLIDVITTLAPIKSSGKLPINVTAIATTIFTTITIRAVLSVAKTPPSLKTPGISFRNICPVIIVRIII